MSGVAARDPQHPNLASPEARKTTDLARRPLVDRFGRTHRSLRISVTDVCNIRCLYCMPDEGAEFLPSEKVISFDRITHVVRLLSERGISRLRLTGGEPLLRPRLHELISRLSAIPGIEDIALTSNGMLLPKHVAALTQAGLRRINISLDTLQEETFQRLSRRPGIGKVIDGIDAALQTKKLVVKLNALVLRDINLDQVVELVEFALARQLELRFIEFMPLDAERAWTNDRMVSGAELRELIQTRFGALRKLPSEDASRPSQSYEFTDHPGAKVGFIDSVSTPFCSNCDRLRLTADGKMRNCLFGTEEWNVSAAVEQGDADFQKTLDECLAAKHQAHGIAAPDFQQPQRAMYQIGG